ncbi:Hypothetical protein, putative [Bodo saltans]|uniref:Uncharacterized protein n=1 Tax=Bodo saltans TaxID=75058 RepID=A0A0S4J6H3_BODSA|nr:Hypothetical protein, putative [Bodo saltans]|eukprot:CUG82662.1 Hypothetical protein, putative [Bodo saltans]
MKRKKVACFPLSGVLVLNQSSQVNVHSTFLARRPALPPRLPTSCISAPCVCNTCNHSRE